MTRFFGVWVIFFLFASQAFASPVGASSALTPPGRTPYQPNYAAMDAYIQEQMRTWNIPGAALVIIHAGQVVHLGAFGRADSSGRPITPQTPFEIGSCTKSFTALAMMQLAEQGEIALDQPVQRYLPWFRTADAQASARITVRHLLNHTSGLPALYSVMVNPDRATLEIQVRRLQVQTLTSPPGTVYQYSNHNYMTLALIIEAVSGQTYGEYLAQHIFTLLDMRNSFSNPAEAGKHGLSGGHTW